MDDLPAIKLAVIIAMLATLMLLEQVLPMFPLRRDRWKHDAANLGLAVINAAVVALGFAWALATVTTWAADHGFGLLRWIALPVWAQWVIALVAFDLWMYTWHVINHKVPLLWRFHAVHHADRELDASSALRFHTVEIVYSSIARCAVLPLLGLSIEQLIVYEMILQPVILFHHSNIRVPEWLDRPLRLIIPTPRMHWVHHSDIPVETDSNYGTVLSVWDRIFRTFRLRDDPSTIQLGLDFTGDHESRDLRGMLAQPFRGVRRTGDNEQDDRSRE